MNAPLFAERSPGRRFGARALAWLTAGLAATLVVGSPAASAGQASDASAGAGSATTRVDGRAALPIDGLGLVRCVPERSMPCVRVRLQVPGAAAVLARSAAGGEGDRGEVALWRARLGPYTLEPVAVRALRTGVPRTILTLVDVSGSMADNGGMQVARAAVRSFVRDLGAGLTPDDTGAVRAGVAGFSSRGVVAGIQAARFTTPEAAAAAVDQLPAPGGNTGLFAAVIAGAERVAAAARQQGEGTRAALVVVTDGRNDVLDPAGRVRPSDDAGLATGADGRDQAVATARRLGVPVFLLGVGNDPDMSELQALAGDDGLALRTAIDAIALRAALAGVDQALTPGREVLFAAQDVERSSLARPGWPVDVVRTAGPPGPDGAPSTGTPTHWTGRWPAPMLTAPGFDGVAFGDGGARPSATGVPTLAPPPSWLRAAADAPAGVGRRGVVALFLAALLGVFWWLPRVLWRVAPLGTARLVPAGAASNGAVQVAYGAVGAGGGGGVLRTVPLRSGTMPASAVGVPAAGAAPAGSASPGSVRVDVQEAPPRRPTDITASGARRRDAAPPAGGQTFAVHRPDPSAPGSGPGPAGRA